MKIKTTILLLFSLSLSAWPQGSNASKILSKEEVKQFFPDSIKEKFNIQYPIRRVYSYYDNSGSYLMALTESINGIEDGDTLHRAIKGFHFRNIKNQLEKVREINDAVEEGESSIWFWTKYCQFTDIDKDGLIDPIIVYGSSYEELEGRVKILVYYKDKKYAIRHHNCSLDDCRFTLIDKEFYNLPASIKEQVKSIMRRMGDNNHAYFGHWEEAMKKQLVKF